VLAVGHRVAGGLGGVRARLQLRRFLPRPGEGGGDRSYPAVSMSGAKPRSRSDDPADAVELLDRLLAFEGELEVLAHRLQVDDMLLWPLARSRVLTHALQSPRPGGSVEVASPSIPIARRVRHLEAALRRDPLRVRGRFDILIFGFTVGISMQRGGKWLDRINDYFALERAENTLVIDASYRRTFREPRCPPHVAFHDVIWARAALRGRIAGGASAGDVAAIQRFARFLREKLPLAPTPASLAALTEHLTTLAARLRFLRDEYMRLFDHTAPKILFLEDASYGNHAYILRWAKMAGIRTGEFQHGMIPATHPAYSYHERIRDSSLYRDYLPEFLLTYGEFWSRNTRTASKLVVLGNPHFETMRGAISDVAARSGGRTIMIVSLPESADDLVALTSALSARVPACDKIIYRLHPHESPGDPRYGSLRGMPNVVISAGNDIYEVLRTTDVVVGTASTVLYEAAGVGLPVFVYSTQVARVGTPSGFGRWFSEPRELLQALSVPSGETIDRYDLFAPDWRARFSDFLKDVLEPGAAGR
jgi:hypothetical protein